MYERFEELLQERGITAYRVAKDTGITTATFTSWKQGKYTPKQDKLQKVADYFGVTLEFLLGKSEEPNEEARIQANDLNEKEQLDIAEELERLMSNLENREALAFHGEPMDEEDRELLRRSLENSLIIARQMAKKKFTPNKYRK